jgi:hypothetical protein
MAEQNSYTVADVARDESANLPIGQSTRFQGSADSADRSSKAAKAAPSSRPLDYTREPGRPPEAHSKWFERDSEVRSTQSRGSPDFANSAKQAQQWHRIGLIP